MRLTILKTYILLTAGETQALKKHRAENLRFKMKNHSLKTAILILNYGSSSRNSS